MKIYLLLFSFLLASCNEADFTMVALGDSATAGFNSGGEFDQPQNSWSTGDSIDSHYTRLRDKMPTKVIRAYNFAVAGMQSTDLVRQALSASWLQSDYSTILIGSNDLCRKMYNPTVLKSNVESAVNILIKAEPKINILISSIPDIVAARKAGENLSCYEEWKAVVGCEASGEPEFQKSLVAFNEVLRTFAVKYRDNVKFSDGVQYAQVLPDSISDIDCFHPSVKGQEAIAELTWAQGFYNNFVEGE